MKRGCLVLGLIAFVSVSTVHAQESAATASEDQEARQLFEAGQLAYEAGRFDSALDYFMRAHELSHRPRMLYNIGQAADRLRRDRTALHAFKQYVAEVPDADNVDMVRNRIAVLETALENANARGDVTPTDAAHAAPNNDASQDAAHLSDSSDRTDDAQPVYTRWWFLAGAGVVVVGTIATVIALSSGDTYANAPAGTDGITVAALVGK